MFHPTTAWKKTWIVGVVLAVALCGAGRRAAAIDPFRPGAFDEGKAILGAWKTLETDEHGAFQPIGLLLLDNNKFLLTVANANGDVVQRVNGHYTYELHVLKLTVDDKPYSEMRVDLVDDSLNLSAGVKKSHWVKDRLPQ